MANPVLSTGTNLLTDLLLNTMGMPAGWYALVRGAVDNLLEAAALENAAQPPTVPAPPTSGNGDTTPTTS